MTSSVPVIEQPSEPWTETVFESVGIILIQKQLLEHILETGTVIPTKILGDLFLPNRPLSPIDYGVQSTRSGLLILGRDVTSVILLVEILCVYKKNSS